MVNDFSFENARDLVTNALRSIIYTPAAEDGDYYENGLLYCGKCHTPRQMRLDLFGDGDEKRVPVLCACEAAEQDAREAEDKGRREQQRKEAARDLAFSDSAWKYAAFVLDDRRDSTASDKCYRYAEHFREMREANVGLMLYGAVGTGKTYLAACIANSVIDQGFRVVMASLPTLIANLGFGNEREETMMQLARVDLLILDDVGVERGTEYSTEQTYEIINARYKAGKPLIVTTNLTMKDIREEQSLGKRRSYDRLVEICRPVMVTGNSRRPDIAREKYAKAARILDGEA